MRKGLSGKCIKALLSMVLGCSALLLTVSSWPQSVHAAATYLYASPTGSGSVCTIGSPCSLSGAQAKVRTLNTSMTGDIIVYLRGGTYSLSSTLQLTQLDSGTGGYQVIYQAYPGEKPVLSGGQTITGWSLFDSGKNIYRSNVGTTLNTRQLYVNEVRATRARGAQNPVGFTKTSTGFTAPDTSMSGWGNKSSMEIVGFNSWKSFRCPVSSISGTAITMQNYCWNNSQLSDTPSLDSVGWIENAYELLDAEGEWYLDRSAGYLYYKPLTGEDIASAIVVAPTLETLVSGTGTLDTPLQNVQIKGLTFAYATWLQPSTSDGYVPLQAGFTFTGLNDAASQYLTKALGNVTFHAAKSVRLERNTFVHLGGAGLVFEYGSQNNTIVGNVFKDISSSGILIGDVTPSHVNPADSRERNSYNTIANNYITKVGAEYFDAVGIFGGYTSYSTITHNELANLPYSGISQGWGWGANSYAQNNQITNNYIHDVMKVLGDGGGIYTLSAQPNSTISGNYLRHMYGSYGGWGIYPDEGSAYLNINNNVVTETGKWISMWTLSIHDNTVQYNYSDTANMTSICTNCTVNNNTTVTNGIWPTAAQTIMSNAGLESAYQDINPPPAVSENLALNQPATAYFSDGITATMWSGFEAAKAVDGNEATHALANGQHIWKLQVDLGSSQSIGRIVVKMPATLYATAFNIQTSTDGNTFTTVKQITGFNSGTSDNMITVRKARYVRVVAVTPNGPSQTGLQMAISELEVYHPAPTQNLAFNQAATAYFSDGSTATMWSGFDAAKALDGNSTTYALANGQHVWKLRADLGFSQAINRIVVKMPAALYATAFDIQTSTDGSAFTTVKQITGFTSGTSDNTITQTNARYVQVVAVTPNGPSQPGVEMAISELEVYLVQ
ncbi:galactose-binding domain-containing protein [Paenibacillus eucommiae]|uniref:F5/8 type C domain-containing protein n=1 Tax=Paenibacillus eucommiae TaxID=1355755 RepID=A0ABS4IMR5_9BACL|nr:discoidin domain-containing protein [Paenibacillus eucommiae]MBP1988863.1 hypothetical protein [Paenibacillus eucommiae]